MASSFWISLFLSLISRSYQECQNITSNIVATGSSVWLNKLYDCGPHLTVDGQISSTWWDFYHSGFDKYAWLQLDFGTLLTVESLSVVMRSDSCYDRDCFENVGIFVGDEPANYGQLSHNPQCALFKGPSSAGATVKLTCQEPLLGQYLIIQIIGEGHTHMMVNEVHVCGY